MFLEDLFRGHYMAIRHLAPKAVACYEVSLRQFDRWLAKREDRKPGKATLADFSDITIARFVSDRERETSRATAKRDRTQLLCLWRYACRTGLMTIWPNPSPLRVPERIPRASKIEEIDALLTYFGKLGDTVDGVPARDWWTSLVVALWQCGTRITETLSVEWPYVDTNGNTILFRAETRKGRTRDIVRDITPELASMLESRRKKTGPVWKWDRAATHLWYRFKAHCEAAGVPYRGFHAIRKAALSYTAAAGGDAQRLGDHSDSKTTRVYMDPSIVKPESNLARLPPLRQTPLESRTDSRRWSEAVSAGFEAGKAHVMAGHARPSREEVDRMAAAAGHGDFTSAFRNGFWTWFGDGTQKEAG